MTTKTIFPIRISVSLGAKGGYLVVITPIEPDMKLRELGKRFWKKHIVLQVR